LSIIPAEEGKIRKINEQLNLTLKNIDLKRQITTSNPTISHWINFCGGLTKWLTYFLT
jgi:hypothetical protein